MTKVSGVQRLLANQGLAPSLEATFANGLVIIMIINIVIVINIIISIITMIIIIMLIMVIRCWPMVNL